MRCRAWVLGMFNSSARSSLLKQQKKATSQGVGILSGATLHLSESCAVIYLAYCRGLTVVGKHTKSKLIL